MERVASFADADPQGAFQAQVVLATQIAQEADQIVERVIDRSGLSPRDQKKLRRRLYTSHWLCELLAVMLCIRRKGRKKIDEYVAGVVRTVVARIVDEVVQHCGVWEDRRLARVIVELLFRKVLVLQIKKLFDLVDKPRILFAVRLATIILCPDVDEHPAVLKECVAPIVARFRQALLVRWLFDHGSSSGTLLSASQRKLLTAAQLSAITS